MPRKARRGYTGDGSQLGAAPRTVSQEGKDLACEECDCPVTMAAPEVLKVRIGTTRDSKRGTRFLLTDTNPRWLHLACAERAGVIPRNKTREKCVLCGHQFFGIDSAEPYEAVMEFTKGTFVWAPGEVEPTYQGESQWLVHWGCVDSFTDLTVTE